MRERILKTPDSDLAAMTERIEKLTLLLREFGYSNTLLLYMLLHEMGHAAGKLYTRLTIGPGTLYKQVLWEHYDDEGNLLDYTLEIYDTETDTVAQTRQVQVKK